MKGEKEIMYLKEKSELYKRMANNFERERIRLNMTQHEMAEYLEMSDSSYKRMISGETDKLEYYTVYKMFKLTNKLGIELAEKPDLQISLVGALKDLSCYQLRFVETMVDVERQLAHCNDGDRQITLLSFTGDMMDGMYYDSMSMKPFSTSNQSATCAIEVTSNHLHPVYHKGDILLVRQQPPRDGDIGIFINSRTSRMYLRKFHQTQPCKLEPINGYGETFYVDQFNEADMSQWIKFGYVLTKVR